MSYPPPTAGRPIQRGEQHKPAPKPFTPYPPVTSGLGIAAKFATIPPVRLKVGETSQLRPVLLDTADKVQTPTERLTYRSNNPRILVSDSGLITTNVPSTVVSRRGASETGIITVSHGSLASVTTFVNVLVTTDFDNIVSD